MAQDPFAETRELQRIALRELLVFERALIELRKDFSKPIDFDHRDNPTSNKLPTDLELVRAASERAFSNIDAFLAEARRVTHHRAWWNHVRRLKQEDQAVRDADSMLAEARETKDNKE